MSIFQDIFQFLWSLFDVIDVTVSGYHFTLGGAVIFAGLVAVFVAFVIWLVSGDR
ncbi:MAG: hypothetical protein IJ079_09215 [Lachnospiraceae bacterium]|nr:hypothetical protein [Lachnospiraceae bacterium]